jgi:citrate synthase
MAENILRMLRPDKSYTELEAKVLDAALVLHMEHGGGNNSTFTARVITSAGSDTYSVISASLSSLKGPKHGGANIKVVEMVNDIKKNVKNTDDEKELTDYLGKILDKKAFDGLGLIYGMGHAVYSISDPRAKILKGLAEKLAAEKGREKDLRLYEEIERITPGLITSRKNAFTGICANVDLYSGFVYDMLGLPKELYTPIFACARVVGWSAHRIEELTSSGKIIRPAYVSMVEEKVDYVPISERK